jgi:hypothetical membrane protein
MPDRLGLRLAAVAAVQITAVSLIDGATRPGFDPWRNWVSQLALGDRSWLGTLNLALGGVWLVLFAAAWRRHRPDAPLVAVLAALCGFGLGLIAATPIDPGLDYPPAVAAVHTGAGAVHQAGALAVFAAGTAAAAVIGRAIDRPRLGCAVAILMTVSFVIAAVLVTLDVTGVLVGTPSGLFERIALYSGLGWIGVAGGCAGHEDRPFQRQ